MTPLREPCGRSCGMHWAASGACDSELAILGGRHHLPEAHALMNNSGQVGDGGALGTGAADIFDQCGDFPFEVGDIGDQR